MHEATRADLAEVKSTLKDMDGRHRKLAEDVAELKGRVSQMPTTIQFVAMVFAILGAAAGILKFVG